jgi:hypothetical protein
MKKFNFFVWTLTVAMLIFAGCDKNDEPSGDPESTGSANMQDATIKGSVKNTNGQPIAGVSITSGETVAVSAADGTFSFSRVAISGNRAVVKFAKDGYFTLTRSGVKEDEMFIEAVLQQKGDTKNTATETFDASVAQTITAGGMKVEVPASSLVKADGTAYSGTVKADMFYLSPNNENFAEVMPGGDLAAIRETGGEAQLISYGMTEVTLTGSDGKPLQLKEGAESKLTFPIPEGMETNPPATIPLWYFDEEKGIWIEEGEATLQGDVYVGEVQHFSWHNLDVPEDRVTIKGKVTDCENNPVAYVKVSVEQLGTSNKTAAVTNSKGEYTVFVPDNTPVTVSIKSADYNNYSPEKQYNIAGQAGNTTVTQNFSLQCSETPPVEGELPSGVTISEASVRYLMNGTETIFTFDNYGKRTRIDMFDTDGSKSIMIADSIAQKCYMYDEDEGWTEQPFSDYGATIQLFVAYFVTAPASYIALSQFPAGYGITFTQTTQTIAGKATTIYKLEFDETLYPEEGGGYFSYGFWNGITMLMESSEEGVILVAQAVVTNVPDEAFTQTVDTSWIQ